MLTATLSPGGTITITRMGLGDEYACQPVDEVWRQKVCLAGARQAAWYTPEIAGL